MLGGSNLRLRAQYAHHAKCFSGTTLEPEPEPSTLAEPEPEMECWVPAHVQDAVAAAKAREDRCSASQTKPIQTQNIHLAQFKMGQMVFFGMVGRRPPKTTIFIVPGRPSALKTQYL